jgi:ferric-dicitrate binding protein FerR (iron transport regulator)
MTSRPCPMADLVEARRDGRLRDRELASLERHIAGCASCRAAEQQLAQMAAYVREPLPGDLTQLEHQRGRLALLRAAVRPAPRAPRWHVAVAPAAALLGIAALVAVAAARSPGPAPLAMHVPRPALPPAVDSREAAARPGTTIRASRGARFDRSSQGGLERVDLIEGALDLQVDPLEPGQRFIVATDDAEVEVRGTVFHVEAHEGALASVSVTEGKVAVRHRDQTTLLLPGEAWPPSSAPPSALPPAPGPASPPVAALGRRARPGAARGGHAPDTDAGFGGGASSAPEESGRSEASRAFADGMSLIEHGEDAAAAEKLEAFRAAHPRDPRAEDAAFLAIVSLQRAGRTAEAKAAAARFLDRYPASPRAAAVKAMAGAP